jgi:hypothetical protein
VIGDRIGAVPNLCWMPQFSLGDSLKCWMQIYLALALTRPGAGPPARGKRT